jgi:solute carrier family 40 (iron-regulated transporter), member 1
LKISSRVLLGRLLTRSGDQAWDFAVPLVLLMLFPDRLRIAALYYFLSKLLNVLLLPKFASRIDHWDRRRAATIGIFLQLAGVLLGVGAIFLFARSTSHDWLSISFFLPFVLLTIGGVLSSLGSSFMDIAIANDLVPSVIGADELASFNSRFRQIDLFTEVSAPVVAGVLLLLDEPRLLGFYLVAAWNIVSFAPELALLRSIFLDRPDLVQKPIQPSEQTKQSIWHKLTTGWRSFFSEPIAPVAIAYAFLWLSVLSPHGVLLSGFLKDGWRMPEWMIGTFRGSGAFFGLLATALFPLVVKRFGLLNGTRNFIAFQTLVLLAALAAFFMEGRSGEIGFLVFVLVSRIGLYGFSLGEMQIRQIGIDPTVRGEVNGFASALTGIATLVLYGAGALLPSTDDFKFLVVGSVVFVALGSLTYLIWLRSASARAPIFRR